VDWLYKKLLTGALRKVLIALATWLVVQGVLDKGDLPTVITKVIEASPAIAAFAWDWIEKYQDAQHRQVALDASGLSPGAIKALTKDVKLK
jgi:hypothetical protein